MKKMLLSLFVSLLLVIGCQENSGNNPVSPNSSNKISSINQTTLQGNIPLDRKLVVQGPGTSMIYYLLKGKIDYTEELINNIANNADLKNGIKLGIIIDATLKDISVKSFGVNSGNQDSNFLRVHSKSENIVQVTADGASYILEQTYPVINGNDKMDLICTFSVATDGVKLERVILNNPFVE